MRLGRRLNRGDKYPALKAENERLNARIAELERKLAETQSGASHTQKCLEGAEIEREAAEVKCEQLHEWLVHFRALIRATNRSNKLSLQRTLSVIDGNVRTALAADQQQVEHKDEDTTP